LVCCGIALIAIGVLRLGTAVPPDSAAQSGSSAGLTASTQRPADFSSNAIVYTADERGHVILDATINGTPVKMLVDTGATLVTLTPGDARAAGIDPGQLQYNGRVSTANGMARMGRVSLREIRIGQLSLYDVPAAVIENLDVSLLGMSFLGRLQGYEMRGGKLTISW
jgi:aspartyl protease family protein